MLPGKDGCFFRGPAVVEEREESFLSDVQAILDNDKTIFGRTELPTDEIFKGNLVLINGIPEKRSFTTDAGWEINLFGLDVIQQSNKHQFKNADCNPSKNMLKTILNKDNWGLLWEIRTQTMVRKSGANAGEPYTGATITGQA